MIPICRSSRLQGLEAGAREVQNRIHLASSDPWEPLQKLIDSRSILEILKERLDRNPRSDCGFDCDHDSDSAANALPFETEPNDKSHIFTGSDRCVPHRRARRILGTRLGRLIDLHTWNHFNGHAGSANNLTF